MFGRESARPLATRVQILALILALRKHYTHTQSSWLHHLSPPSKERLHNSRTPSGMLTSSMPLPKMSQSSRDEDSCTLRSNDYTGHEHVTGYSLCSQLQVCPKLQSCNPAKDSHPMRSSEGKGPNVTSVTSSLW